MAQVVLGIGTSHGPSIQTPPEQWRRLADGDTRDPRFDYQRLLRNAKPGLERELQPKVQRGRYDSAHAALSKLTVLIEDAALDVIVVVSNQHRVYPDDQHPVFGFLRASSFPVMKRSNRPFDPDARFRETDERAKAEQVAERPGHAALANHLIASLIDAGFDVASVDRLRAGATLDDAFAFAYDWLLRDKAVPLVPLFLSRDLPNQPTARRCVEFGAAVREKIESYPESLRVGLIASGGLSHQIVDEELDRSVIAALQQADIGSLRRLARDRLNVAPGTPEILNWVAVASAMAPARMTLIDYLPCYRSPAGTGHGLTFGYWR